MKTIGLFVKKADEAICKADALASWLKDRGMTVIRRESSLPGRRMPEERGKPPPSALDCVFVLGGDGTFLSAVRWIGDRAAPVLGIKFGEVGFLAETAAEHLYDAADAVLRGQFTVESRMRLTVTVRRENETAARETVLNDVVINKGALARLASIEASISGHYLTTFRADGLIVATATGSTAYSLAAGGPVLHPDVSGIILTPICPFTLTNRPLIIPDTAVITLRLAAGTQDIMLTFDGQVGVEINEKDTIYVEKSPHPVHMICLPGRNYFEILKSKLRWSGGRV